MSWHRRATVVALLVIAGCGDDSPRTSGDAGMAEPEVPGPTEWVESSESLRRHGVVDPVLLPDGRVLIVGGDDSGDSVEAFDPATESWTDGAMGVNARASSATLLADGRVLVVGTSRSRNFPDDPVGRIPDPLSLSNQVYLVSADLTATAAAPTGTARTQHTATRLDSGTVLVAGGATVETAEGPVVVTATAELYQGGGWTETGSLSEARFQHTATRLDSGEVVVIGGRDTAGTFFSSVEIYDPASGSWRSGAPMATARAGHAAVLLGSGRVLVAGGVVEGGATATAELYDPAADTWTSAPDLPRVAAFPAGGRLPSGDALIAGGAESDLITAHGQAVVFDESADGWAAMDDLPGGTDGFITYEGRMAAGLVVLDDGRVVIMGGWGKGRTIIPTRTAILSDGPFHE